VWFVASAGGGYSGGGVPCLGVTGIVVVLAAVVSWLFILGILVWDLIVLHRRPSFSILRLCGVRATFK